MGHKQVTPRHAVLCQQSAEEEVRLAAKDWAEFLYEEYCREKQDKLILGEKCSTIKKLTNHDKLNP